MSSKENKLSSDDPTFSWFEEPEGQRRAHLMANRLARRYRLSSMTGDDLYHLAMMKLLRYFPSGPPPEIKRPLAYLFRVLSNEARGLFAQEQRHQTIPLEDVPDEKFSDHFEIAQRIESGILLREVLNTLNNEERQLFTLMLNGFTTSRKLASKLDISHVTAAYRVAKLKGKIRKAIL